jgi:hypothetical protein
VCFINRRYANLAAQTTDLRLFVHWRYLPHRTTIIVQVLFSIIEWNAFLLQDLLLPQAA